MGLRVLCEFHSRVLGALRFCLLRSVDTSKYLVTLEVSQTPSQGLQPSVVWELSNLGQCPKGRPKKDLLFGADPCKQKNNISCQADVRAGLSDPEHD